MPYAKDNIPVRETGLSVLIPAYNEQQGVGLVVKALREELSETGRPFEILIVDDFPTLEKTDLSLDLRPYVQQLG